MYLGSGVSRTGINYERRPLEVRFTMTELFGECVMRSSGDSMRTPARLCINVCAHRRRRRQWFSFTTWHGRQIVNLPSTFQFGRLPFHKTSNRKCERRTKTTSLMFESFSQMLSLGFARDYWIWLSTSQKLIYQLNNALCRKRFDSLYFLTVQLLLFLKFKLKLFWKI